MTKNLDSDDTNALYNRLIPLINRINRLREYKLRILQKIAQLAKKDKDKDKDGSTN